MTWDSVPWFTGGGAHHSPEVARLLAYAATSGAEGIVTPGDLKVVPLNVPGASVRVLAGAALILNRAASGSQQTYVARNPSEDVKGITATGSGSGRNDLVIARIEDPYLPGEPWADPADPTVGPYIFSRVLPNVPSSAVANPAAARAYLVAQGISGIPLAAVILPASTGTVTTTAIRDLRDLALPRESRVVQSSDRSGMSNLNVDSPTFVRWPEYAPTVTVPSWATDFRQTITVTSVRQFNATTKGAIRATLGPIGGSSSEINLVAANGTAHVFIASNGGSCLTQRGNSLVSQSEASITEGGIFVTAGAQIVHDIQFYERAV